jgi:hypothetical protein
MTRAVGDEGNEICPWAGLRVGYNFIDEPADRLDDLEVAAFAPSADTL